MMRGLAALAPAADAERCVALPMTADACAAGSLLVGRPSAVTPLAAPNAVARPAAPACCSSHPCRAPVGLHTQLLHHRHVLTPAVVVVICHVARHVERGLAALLGLGSWGVQGGPGTVVGQGSGVSWRLGRRSAQLCQCRLWPRSVPPQNGACCACAAAAHSLHHAAASCLPALGPAPPLTKLSQMLGPLPSSFHAPSIW